MQMEPQVERQVLELALHEDEKSRVDRLRSTEEEREQLYMDDCSVEHT